MASSEEVILTALEARAREANTLAELTFSIANDSYSLLPFRQALVFAERASGAPLLAVSGLARPTEDSPYLVWLRRGWPWLRARFEAAPGWFSPAADASEMPDEIRQGWAEWWPAGALALPLRRRSGETLGWVCFLLDEPPAQTTLTALQRLASSWSYCWEMLAAPRRRGVLGSWRRLPAWWRRG